MTDDADANPGQLVAAAVDQGLALARTWHAWDGRPIARVMDDGLPNTWTPHKALRRITDHLVDHLHQVEALLAGATPVPDEWHGRTVTLDADWARFTEVATPRFPGCAGSAAGTRCATRLPGRRPGTSLARTPGRCARSPSTWPA